MLEIEILMQKYDFCRILDCHNSTGELELAMASWDQSSLVKLATSLPWRVDF